MGEQTRMEMRESTEEEGDLLQNPVMQPLH